MISQLRGTLLQRSPTRTVIDVNGVGYAVAITVTTFDELPPEGEAVVLLTHTHVREDRLELFGFSTEQEREMFVLLINVSGIGPTLAQTILSGMPTLDLQQHIFHGRAEELTKVRGVGRKTAERVVIDLKDKISTPGSDFAQPGVDVAELDSVTAEEAVMTLIALGIAPASARKAVVAAQAKVEDDATLQQLIKQALRER